jgi:hypothetical protein
VQVQPSSVMRGTPWLDSKSDGRRIWNECHHPSAETHLYSRSTQSVTNLHLIPSLKTHVHFFLCIKHMTACFSKVFSILHCTLHSHEAPFPASCPPPLPLHPRNVGLFPALQISSIDNNKPSTRERVNGAAVAIDTIWINPPLSETLSENSTAARICVEK